MSITKINFMPLYFIYDKKLTMYIFQRSNILEHYVGYALLIIYKICSKYKHFWTRIKLMFYLFCNAIITSKHKCYKYEKNKYKNIGFDPKRRT